MLRIKNYNLVILTLILAAIGSTSRADKAVTTNREYQTKAAFLHNFIKFVDWPEAKFADSNQPIIIGIIGKEPLGYIFELLEEKKIKGRRVFIQRFDSFDKLEENSRKDRSEFYEYVRDLRKCHLLFICSSENKNIKKIIKVVQNHSVLTVGETKRFLESGGIINFDVENKKIYFEINLDACKQTKLKISSQLLRLAKRVTQPKGKAEQANQ